MSFKWGRGVLFAPDACGVCGTLLGESLLTISLFLPSEFPLVAASVAVWLFSFQAGQKGEVFQLFQISVSFSTTPKILN